MSWCLKILLSYWVLQVLGCRRLCGSWEGLGYGSVLGGIVNWGDGELVPGGASACFPAHGWRRHQSASVFQLNKHMYENKLRAQKISCMPSSFPMTRRSPFAQPPKIFFFFEGLVPTPGIVSPGSITIPELNQHRATSHTQTTMACIFSSVIYGTPEPHSCFPQWQGTRFPYSHPSAPGTCPGGTPRGNRCWLVGASVPASHLKQAPNSGCRFSRCFVGRRSCRLREMRHEAGLLCRIKSK